MVAIDVAKCPFETVADNTAHRPRLEGRGRRTIDEQHGRPRLKVRRFADHIGQDLLLALRILEVALMLCERVDSCDPDQRRRQPDKYYALPLAEQSSEKKARDADCQRSTDRGIEEHPVARVPPSSWQIHCEPCQDRDDAERAENQVSLDIQDGLGFFISSGMQPNCGEYQENR